MSRRRETKHSLQISGSFSPPLLIAAFQAKAVRRLAAYNTLTLVQVEVVGIFEGYRHGSILEH